MPQTITETATLQCNQGTAESKLSVSSQNFFFIRDHAIATEADNQTGVNIKSFGLCKLKPIPGGYLPCTPVPINWAETTKKDELNGNKILLDCSVCPCTTGGIISVKDKGHGEEQEG
ncbi:DUF4280 domain-containing protein [Apibacter muscae]|uniref:DUF4280 domain-containing protein n=1 Tax=Apibacter muscae TaxID=2509004 RepID=A0A563DEI4_9FLAO|nr:DUF4280 domain-containing protein [Apibacter muscae]TWP28361.1 DUF4280 domain-containing protein [Apibacter muscae]